jgi:hypothetical protein
MPDTLPDPDADLGGGFASHPQAFGGIYWRSDNLVGLQLGEAVTLGILADERRTYNEHYQGFSLTKFDGTTITV